MRSYSLKSILLLFLHLLSFSMRMQRCKYNALGCLEEGTRISDNGTDTILVSPGSAFELGFFTPDGSSNGNRYLGIWYYDKSYPKTVVWVANRDKPLLKHYGYLVIQNGKAELFDAENTRCWSTSNANSPPTSNTSSPDAVLHLSRTNSPHMSSIKPSPFTSNITGTELCLAINGNLILKDRRQLNPILWKSFSQPTDTFIPGMIADGFLHLSSWQTRDDPAPGKFTLFLQPSSPSVTSELEVVETGVPHFWESGNNPLYKPPQALSEMLVMNNTSDSICNTTRLVMNFTGQVQFWRRTYCGESWSLNWSEPNDVCSLDNVCGEFGSCNSKNGSPCKCLPGFKPSATWKPGNTSGGCTPKSGLASDRDDSSSDTFLELPMMTMGNLDYCRASIEENCADQCLKDITCVAYSYSDGAVSCKGAGNTSEKRCLTWSNELLDLQEENVGGFTLFLRTRRSDIELTPRDCKPCGTYIIPYPLSTAANCGDSSYFSFHCNAETGQVNFSTHSGTFKVNLIDPVAERFYIQVKHSNSCESGNLNSSVLSLQHSLPFYVRNCNVVNNQPLIDVEQPFLEVEIGWQPAPEIACNTSSDCHHWNHTTCKTGEGDKMRCICGSKFRWDGSKLKCTRVPFPIKVVASCVGGALAIVLFCGMFFFYHMHKRRIPKRQDTLEFQGKDTEGIDVPFFDWGSILAATNNFADANKLGTGGFGSVYKGKLPDGKEIAVKRLSSVSVHGVEEFRTEVVVIAKLQHRNLVRLLGYCVKADEKILVYEYMPNGSLDSCLFDDTFPVQLDWEKRFDIILGIARGLLYLHQDSRLRIIHRDLKPSNILLDEDLNPKISDFGIARIVGGKETEANTRRIVGTYGYMSPEYAYEGLFSVKSDVFSFGVVMLETISGRRNSRIFVFEHGQSLLGHAWRLWKEGRGLDLIDEALKESCQPSEVLKCIHVGLLCVQEEPSDRPTMSSVILMFGSETTSLPDPRQPAFSTKKDPSETASSSSAMDSSLKDVITVSTEGR